MKRIDENHSFNKNVCCVLKGHCQKAILLKEIYGWCQINQAKNHNIRFGVVWSFMSATGFAEKFDYMNEKSIARWLKELVNEGWLFSSVLNKKAYDRTKWYTVNFCRYDDAILKNKHSISQIENWTSQIEKLISQIEQPIPSSTTTSTTTSTNITLSKGESSISNLKNQKEKEERKSSAKKKEVIPPPTSSGVKTFEIALANYDFQKNGWSQKLKENFFLYWKIVDEKMKGKYGETQVFKRVRQVESMLSQYAIDICEEAIDMASDGAWAKFYPKRIVNDRARQEVKKKKGFSAPKKNDFIMKDEPQAFDRNAWFTQK